MIYLFCISLAIWLWFLRPVISTSCSFISASGRGFALKIKTLSFVIRIRIFKRFKYPFENYFLSPFIKPFRFFKNYKTFYFFFNKISNKMLNKYVATWSKSSRCSAVFPSERFELCPPDFVVPAQIWYFALIRQNQSGLIR